MRFIADPDHLARGPRGERDSVTLLTLLLILTFMFQWSWIAFALWQGLRPQGAIQIALLVVGSAIVPAAVAVVDALYIRALVDRENQR